jgi:hypothetical protein
MSDRFLHIITPPPSSSCRGASSIELEEGVNLEVALQHDEGEQSLRVFNLPSNGLPSSEKRFYDEFRTLLISAVLIIATSLFVVLFYRNNSNHTVLRLARIDFVNDTATSRPFPDSFALQFVPTTSVAATRDYVTDDDPPRVFAPGRLILRPSTDVPDVAFHIDACVLSDSARALIERSIHAAVVAQNSPQCLRTCRVVLPPPRLQCPGAALHFTLPNSMLLPAGASLFEFAGVAAVNGTVGLPFAHASSASTIVSLDDAQSRVVVMQVQSLITRSYFM